MHRPGRYRSPYCVAGDLESTFQGPTPKCPVAFHAVARYLYRQSCCKRASDFAGIFASETELGGNHSRCNTTLNDLVGS